MRWIRIIGRHPYVSILALAAALTAGGVGVWRQRAEQILRAGEQALEAREYAKAREHLEHYLTIYPQSASARLLAARAARRQRDFDSALEHLRRCRDDGVNAEAIDVEYALISLKRGDDKAAPWLRERARQEDALALVILEGLIQYDIDTYRLWQALEDLNEHLRRCPDDLQALLGRGFVWERFLSFADARNDYQKAVEAHPKSERARLRLADTLLIAGTPDEALAHYRWLAERWPERPEVRLGLARCMHRLGQPAAAQEQLDALLVDDPNHGEANWERGQVALDQDQPEAAEPWLRRAVKALPYDRRIVYSLERCLRALGRADEAEQYRARAVQLEADVLRLDKVRQEVMKRPNDATLWCEAGLLFLRNGEPEEGIRWLRTALRLDPSCDTARKAIAAHALPTKTPFEP